MLLDKLVLVKRRYNYNLDYYLALGYDINQDEFLVDIKHLLKNSFTVVKVSCDYCGDLDNIPYYKWNRSMESPIKKYCCKFCKSEKTKESNLLKYGFTSVSKLDSSKQKSKKTNLEKYGVEFHTQSNSTKSKIKKTNLDKWGVENPMQSLEIKEKQRETIKLLYNVDNISKLDEIKEKKRETTLLNFGVDSPLKSEVIREKVKVKNKLKFGNEYITKSEIFRKDNYDIANDKYYDKYLEDGFSLFSCDYGMDHKFSINKDVYSKRKLYEVGLCTVCNPISENSSIKEKDLFTFISSIYSGSVLKNWRDGRMEIDVYLPELKIGFEFNGLYWHSDKYKERNYHLDKLNYFREKNIRIINIWEDNWDINRDILKSQIKNLLGLSDIKIFARKCVIKEVGDKKLVKNFLNKNHIQGYVNSFIKLGLYYNDELVSIMNFDHFEGRKKMCDDEWNLNRFCNKINTNVVGGASKLFRYFIKNWISNRIISYADRDWSVGNLYYKLDFKLVNTSRPDYKYILKGKRINKSRFRNSKEGILESKLDLLKIWDCGKLKFEIIK